MNSQRITWFWPVSFLGALGQMLLLLTDNRGGPELARFALAIWTLWLPGVWLGNLLTKPGTRLLTRLPVQISCALAVLYLLILVRWWGAGSERTTAFLACGLALVVALAHLVLPADRASRRTRIPGAPRAGAYDPIGSALILAAAIGLGALHLVTGAPLSVRPDAADQVLAVHASDEVTHPAPVHGEGMGTAARDPDRGPVHAAVACVARLAHLEPIRVWNRLPLLAVPWLLLALYFVGCVIFENRLVAAVAALFQLALFTNGPAGGSLMAAGFPAMLALVPFWTAVGLYLDGQDQPHLKSVLAFGLCGLAVWGTHFVFGVLLVAVMAVVAIRSLTSVERLQEGLPLLVALWVPWLVLSGAYLLTRFALLGSLHAFRTPARDLLVLGPDRVILSPALPVGVAVAAGVAYLFLPVLLPAARRRVSASYLLVVIGLAPLVLFNPWLTSRIAAALGSGIHFAPWTLPLGFVLVAQAVWAFRGLARSEGWTWVRFLVVLGIAVVAITGVRDAVVRFAYRPAAIRELRERPPQSLRALGLAAADTLRPGSEILADPGVAAALGAYAGLPSVYRPEARWTPEDAETRYVRTRLLFLDAAAHADSGSAARIHAGLVALLRDYPARYLVAGVAGTGDDRFGDDRGAAVLSAAVAAGAPGLGRIDLGNAGTASLLPAHPPEPGSTPVRLGPDRPPFSTAFPAPTASAVVLDTTRGEPGSTIRIGIRWRPGPAEALDPRGYRQRVELWHLAPPEIGVRERMGGFFERTRDTLLGRRRGWAEERPLAGGEPSPLWAVSTIEDTLAVTLPEDLVPGVYEVRVAALPGPVAGDRYRAGLVFLPGGSDEPRITVLPRGP